MQVPEKLTLIGGSILLASTLIFTLKSQASNILPKVAQPISNIQDKTSDAQNGNDFSDGLKQAQQKGWQTGSWGSAKFYIDNNQNMYVGSGSLQGALKDIPNAGSINSLNFERAVTAPADSSYLLTPTNWNDNYSLKNINGAEKINTSQVSNMYRMFGADSGLKSVNVSTWDTSNVNNMCGVFVSNDSIQEIQGINNWDTQNVKDISYSFYHLSSIDDLNLSHWNTPKLYNADYMFANTPTIKSINISNMNTNKADTNNIFGMNVGWNHTDSSLNRISLGNDTKLNTDGMSGDWQANNQTIGSSELFYSNATHPGTWIKQ